MMIECTKDELLSYAKAQYQLGMLDGDDNIAEGVALYIDELFIELHKVGEEE